MTNPRTATASITVFGIANCDTVKKSRLWLEAQAITYQFHDFKKHAVPPALLPLWLARVGWQTLLNRKGATWRGLDASVQASVVDDASAQPLLLAHASAIKRPVVQWSSEPSDISVGFDAAAWSARLAAARTEP